MPAVGGLRMRQCPLTCGLATRMTEGGWIKACEARRKLNEKFAETSADIHVLFCRECQGRIRPPELEIINLKELSVGTKPSGEKEWVMPAELAEVLRPMSVAEAETATISSLVKFWRRPLIKYDAQSACPCCGGVHRLRSSGICSGCYSTNVISNNLTGLALLEHLAKRAAGVNQRFGKKKVIKSITPASEPPPPAAHPAEAGAVEVCGICGVKPPTRESLGMPICATCDHLRRGVRNQPELVVALLRQAHPDLLPGLGSMALPDLVIEERNCLADIVVEVGQALDAGEERNLALVAVQRMAELAEARATIREQIEMIGELKTGQAEVRHDTCEAILGIMGIGDGYALGILAEGADLEAITASKILEAITAGVWRDEAMSGGQDAIDEEVVARWSGEALCEDSFAVAIGRARDDLKGFLLAKNTAYGNSAADPVRVFSKASPIEQINVRIDDKLSRMMRGATYPGDDDELDLVGYLILKRALVAWHGRDVEVAA